LESEASVLNKIASLASRWSVLISGMADLQHLNYLYDLVVKENEEEKRAVAEAKRKRGN
jgi:hypothetical protein